MVVDGDRPSNGRALFIGKPEQADRKCVIRQEAFRWLSFGSFESLLNLPLSPALLNGVHQPAFVYIVCFDYSRVSNRLLSNFFEVLISLLSGSN